MASGWVSINQAAKQLGVSPDTIRRRLKRGELQGTQTRTPQGFVWQIEVPSEPENSEHKASEHPAAAIAEDAFELERLRERVAGLERERGELIAQRDAWQDQARRSGEGEAQLRELVARAQTLAQALPASTGGDRGHAPESQPARAQGNGRGTDARKGWLDRLRKR